MARYTRRSPRNKQNFKKFEIVWARKANRAWWPCKVLEPYFQSTDNFLIMFLKDGKIVETASENVRKYTKENEDILVKDWQKRLIGKKQQVIEKEHQKPTVSLSQLSKSIRMTRSAYQKKIQILKKEKSKQGASMIRKIKKIRKNSQKRLINKKRQTEKSEIKNASELKQMQQQRNMLHGGEIQERLDDTTQNFQTLGTKLAIFAKKFYKILKKKGLNQSEAQKISIILAHFNNSHQPKNTFHRILDWIRSNTAEYIKTNYENI